MMISIRGALLLAAAGALLSSWAAAMTDPTGLDEMVSEFNKIYRTASVTSSSWKAVDAKTSRPVVAVARTWMPDDTPCSTIEGLWLSVNLETAFVVSVSDVPVLFDVQAVGSDWTGTAEAMFGTDGPFSMLIGQPSSGQASTFVGNCRVIDRVDSITGIWVLASPEQSDYHLAVQPIPDKLIRLKVEYS